MLQDLIKLANDLDTKGLIREADVIDRLLVAAKIQGIQQQLLLRVKNLRELVKSLPKRLVEHDLRVNWLRYITNTLEIFFKLLGTRPADAFKAIPLIKHYFRQLRDKYQESWKTLKPFEQQMVDDFLQFKVVS